MTVCVMPDSLKTSVNYFSLEQYIFPSPDIKSFNIVSMYIKTFNIHMDYNQNVKYYFCK